MIPIIGDPKIGDWFFTVSVTCTCGHNFLWIGTPGNGGPGSVAVCAKCKKGYTILRMPTYHPVTNDIQLSLGVSNPQEDADARIAASREGDR